MIFQGSLFGLFALLVALLTGGDKRGKAKKQKGKKRNKVEK